MHNMHRRSFLLGTSSYTRTQGVNKGVGEVVESSEMKDDR